MGSLGLVLVPTSREVFLRLVQISRIIDESKMSTMIYEQDYEEFDLYIVKSSLGAS